MARSLFHKLSLYTTVGLLNLTIAMVFYAVNSKPPILAVASSISQSLYVPKPFDIKQGIPNRIAIPSLSIDIPVKVGIYNDADDNWSLDGHNAFFAKPSALVNNLRGNSLIYGHRLPAVFEKLPALNVQDEVIVYTDSGYTFHYNYQSREEVEPTDVSVFSDFGPPTLTLQSCTGGWNQYRVLYSLKLQSVNKT